MSFEKSFFSGARIDFRAPCTSSEGRLCDIFENLQVWNELFWQANFELQELSPGELSLVRTYGKQIRDPRHHASQLVDEKAATLLRHLLTHHHCLVSVDLTSYLLETYSEVTCDALCKSASLRKLTLHLYDFPTLSFTAALPQMNQLQVFDCGHVIIDRTFSEVLSNFLASTRSLTQLDMSRSNMEDEDAALIIQGLERNATITTLSISESLIKDTSECSLMLSDYLSASHTLRVLSVISHDVTSYNKLGPLIGALCQSSTLFELNLIRCSLYTEYFEVIIEMLRHNRTLSSFHMTRCFVYDNVSTFRSESISLISLWSMALAENKALKELTLDLYSINPDEYGPFFKALATNTSLEKLTIESFNENDVAQICRALRDTGVHERFFVSRHLLSEDTIAVLPEFKELSRISAEYRSPHDVETLHTTLCVLPTCDHVKSLHLRIEAELLKGNEGFLVANYIANTTALRELRLEILFDTLYGGNDFECDWNAVDRPQRTLLQALAFNKSINILFLRGLCITEAESQMLVDTLQTSRTICHMSFHPECDCRSDLPLIRKLAANVSSNYMLLGVHTEWYKQLSYELFTITDVVRRNNSLVTRAADFVMGKRHRYCGAAAELVQFNPGLVEKVQELASIDETEAASRIERSLKSFTELDDFMCLAGVVKYSVSCQRRDDGQKQLVDLNRDCWLYLRQCLKVGDILDAK
ncbi:hypothetical protein HPB52_003999 [Rhipicephalus sanguineus]|uniref:Nlr family card domain protein n=1 Tax=Rhipicephalus sanguineus TaxID=34632 RepID=A0A9D4SRK7_RHISA|nr:hypothetical protein HPB52_003999 [Rhipicephalus sanguineus]